MATYCFRCSSPDHPESMPRDFEKQIWNISEKKRIDQYKCECGVIAKRDLSKELPTQAVIGATPITPSDVKGTLGNETQFAFGKFKQNPDGSVDTNHAAFRDTGELNKYLNGQNDLGEPVVKDDGKLLRRKDGSVVRRGAKLVKLDRKAPSKTDVRRDRPRVPSAWIDEKTAGVKTIGGVKF